MTTTTPVFPRWMVRVGVAVIAAIVVAMLPLIGAGTAHAATSSLQINIVLQGGGTPPANSISVDYYTMSENDSCTFSCSKSITTPDDLNLSYSALVNGYAFVSWSGVTCNEGDVTGSTCTVANVTSASTVTVTLKPRTLSTVNISRTTDGPVSGAGGDVSFSQSTTDGFDAAIDCGATCSSPMDRSKSGFLSATANSTYSFESWSGVTCAEGQTSPDCTFTTSSATVSPIAAFITTPTSVTLTVSKKVGTTVTAAAGTVTVSSSLPDSVCDTSCSTKPVSVGYNDSLTITATAAPGYLFDSWTGECAAETSNVCSTSLAANASTAAIFILGKKVTVTVVNNPTANGTVTIDDTNAFLTCPTDCTTTVKTNTKVTLTVGTLPAGTKFAGWSGGCSGTANECVLDVASDVNVTATFNAIPVRTVTFTKAGAAANDSSLNFGPDVTPNCVGNSCTVQAGEGTTIDVDASAAADGALTSWTGCTKQLGSICRVTVPASNATYTASFEKVDMATLNVNVVAAAGSPSLPPAARASGNDIDCGAVCARQVRAKTPIPLYSNSVPGWTAAWSGCSLSSTPDTCTAYVDGTAPGTTSVTLTYTYVGTWNVTLNFSAPPGDAALYISSSDTFTNCPTSPCSLGITKGNFAQVEAYADSAPGGSVSMVQNDPKSPPCTFYGGVTDKYCSFTPTGNNTFTASWGSASTALIKVSTTTVGSGTGTPSANPSSCAAPAGCARTVGSYFNASPVTPIGWHFDGFSGCPGTTTRVPYCSFTVSGAAAINAQFTWVGTWTVTATRSGTGGSFSLYGNDSPVCTPTQCTVKVTKGNSASVQASDVGDGVSVAFTGCDTVSALSTCSVKPAANRSVTVTFGTSPLGTINASTDTVSAADLRAGSLDSSDLDCGSSCSLHRQIGDRVTIDASDGSAGYVFLYWTGCPSASGASCSLTVSATPQNVVAHYGLPSSKTSPLALRTLTLNPGSGGALSTDSIQMLLLEADQSASCTTPGPCTGIFYSGQAIHLFASASSGKVFTGWSGTCTGAINPCLVTMTADKAVGSRFAGTSTLEAEKTAGTLQTWGTLKVSGSYGGTTLQSNGAGATATYTFAGKSISYFFTKGPDQGTAIVKVDGKVKGTISQYAKKRTLAQRFTVAGLSNAKHSISITVSAVRPKGSVNTYVSIDAFIANTTVCGSKCVKTPPVVARWGAVALATASGKYFVQSQVAGSTMTFSFTGTGIDVYRVRGKDKGQAYVYLDGVYKGTVNDYSAATSIVVQSFRGLALKGHTLKILVLRKAGSTKVPTALNVGIDRAVIIG